MDQNIPPNNTPPAGGMATDGIALQAVIFDVDGTLADTERDGHRVAFNRAFEEFDLDWHWTPELYNTLLAVAGGKDASAFSPRSTRRNCWAESTSTLGSPACTSSRARCTRAHHGRRHPPASRRRPADSRIARGQRAYPRLPRRPPRPACAAWSRCISTMRCRRSST